METKKSVSPALIAVAVVVLLGFIGFIAFKSFGSGGDGSAPGGTDAKTVAPVVQKYSDGTPVPYNAAPSGATPGNPASIRR